MQERLQLIILNVTDFETSIKSARLAWITRFFREESYPSKAYLLYLLKDFGGDFFLYCNYNINDYNICSDFYKEMLLWWSDLRAKYDTSSSYKFVIWNNHEVRVNDKPIYYPNYIKANIIFSSDLRFDISNTVSFTLAKENGLHDSNFLTWTGVRCAIPRDLRVCPVNGNRIRTLQFQIGDKIFNPALSKCKDFYALLIADKATQSRGFTKLKSKFCLDDEDVRKAFSLIKSTIFETFVQCFQFKILNDITFTNFLLAKIGLIPSDLCTFCNSFPETIDHLFFECFYSSKFWEQFESYWSLLSLEQREINLKTVLIGVIDTKCDLLNYLIVLGKLHLWNCRRNNILPFCPVF